jgi:hypothetical protein
VAKREITKKIKMDKQGFKRLGVSLITINKRNFVYDSGYIIGITPDG